MDKLKLIEILNDIQQNGNDFRDVEIHGIRIPDTVSNEDVADHLIANGVTVQKWIPVTERLPDKAGEYLVLSKSRNQSVQWFYINGDYRDFLYVENGTVTHWMPLPNHPKEEA